MSAMREEVTVHRIRPGGCFVAFRVLSIYTGNGLVDGVCQMKKLGIVGGVGWVGTIDYYRLMCTMCAVHFRALGYNAPLPTPPMTIESIVMADARKVRRRPGANEEEWAAYDAMFRDAILRLEATGCDLAIIASNTPHSRIHSIREGTSIPILSILEETALAVKATGARSALVLGTDVIMEGTDYATVLRSHGIAPNERLPETQINEIQTLIDNQFQQERFEEGRERLRSIIEAHDGAGDGCVVVLACTDFSPAFPEHAGKAIFVSDDITFVNSTVAHAQTAFKALLS